MPFVSFDHFFAPPFCFLSRLVAFYSLPRLKFSVPFTRSFVIVALLNYTRVYAHNSAADTKLDTAKLDSHF